MSTSVGRLRVGLVFVVFLLLLAGLAGTAVAQENDIFYDGLESGDICAWTLAPATIGITSTHPLEGGIGTIFNIEGFGFGVNQRAPEVFLSSSPSAQDGTFLEVLGYDDNWIEARFNGGVAVGDYLVNVALCFPALTALDPYLFGVRLPTELSIAPQFAGAGDTVILSGLFFGSIPGQISILSLEDGSVGDQSVAIASWADSVPISGTGFLRGEVAFTMPSTLPANGLYDLTLTNTLGTVTLDGDLVAVDVDDGDTEALRLVSAVATSNTEILVQFSEAVRGGIESAENPAHYRIAAPARTPTIHVLAAEVLRPHLSTVRLTTVSQGDLLYTLSVSNLLDLAGNPLASPLQFEIDPTKTDFVGIPPGGGGTIDSDGDGLSDADEQLGWMVTVTHASGATEERHVTSDPGNPFLPLTDPFNIAARDTEGDGVTDNEEKHGATDPRSADTDGDTLTDNEEWNIIFSDPTHQDTDGDGVQDGFEFYSFRTSPILADTDGDQLLDGDEITASNRNARIADLPRAGISVGEVRLEIDERYTYVDSESNTQSIESSSSSSLTQSEDTTYATSNSDVEEHVAGGNLQTGFEPGDNGRGDKLGGLFLTVEGSYQYTNSNTFQTSSESARSSQQVHEQSVSRASEINTTSEVTREVVDARISVDLTIRNDGDLAFSISNLEITVLQRSRFSTNTFLPVATLIPNSTLITGEPAVFNLGPFTPERGPIIFSSRDVFPNLVDELMKSPNGLIFKVANFDMTDEFGRIFTFSNQTARDRTAGIIVDFGDGTVRQDLVATALQPDPEDYAGDGPDNPFVGGFADQSLPLGIPLDFALQDILGLIKSTADNPALVDGIVAGINKAAESIAQGDDVQVIPRDTTGLTVGTVVVSAGQNGILDTPPLGDDVAEVTTGYETSLTCDATSDRAQEICTVDTDCLDPLNPVQGSCSGPEILVRFNGHRNGDLDRIWVVLTNRELRAGADFGSVILKPGADIFFAFVQDLDEDGLFAREEYLVGSTDSRADRLNNDLFGADTDGDGFVDPFFEAADPQGCTDPDPLRCDGIADSKDTDRDGLGDFAEVRVSWKVSTEAGIRNVHPSPRLRDSDGDGLLDPEEQDLRGFCGGSCVGGDNDGRYCEDNGDCFGGTCNLSFPPQADPRGGALCSFQGNGLVSQADAIAVIAGPNGRADTLANKTAPADDVQLIAVGVKGLPYGAAVVGPGENGVIDTNVNGGYCPRQKSFCTSDADCEIPGETCVLDGDDEFESSTRIPPATDPSLADTDADFISDREELVGFTVGRSVRDGGNGVSETRSNGDDVQRSFFANPVRPEGAVILPGSNGTIESCGSTPGDGDSCGENTAYGLCEVQPMRCSDTGNTCTSDLDCTGLATCNPFPNLCNAVFPGGNVKLECEIAGDPCFVDDDTYRGGMIVVTDPLRRDTDSDGVGDGREFEQGGDPTDDSDAADFIDSDQDGLTDSEEIILGWDIVLNDCPGQCKNAGTLCNSNSDCLASDTCVHKGTCQSDGAFCTSNSDCTANDCVIPGRKTVHVFSNPSVPDSDLDGLPDFVERDIRTNPNSPDTDGDGLRDFDELADFSPYIGLEQQFPRFAVDGERSERHGTSPTCQDTDGDTQDDRRELVETYRLLLGGEETARVIATNPLSQDTDFDGVPDNFERFGHTIPDIGACINSSACQDPYPGGGTVSCNIDADCKDPVFGLPVNPCVDQLGSCSITLAACSANADCPDTGTPPASQVCNLPPDLCQYKIPGETVFRTCSDDTDCLLDLGTCLPSPGYCRGDSTVCLTDNDCAPIYEYPITDASDPDTDDDTRVDGVEFNSQTDPLQEDIGVSVTFAAIDIDFANTLAPNPFEARWNLSVGIGTDFPGPALSRQIGDVTPNSLVGCSSEPYYQFTPINSRALLNGATKSFRLRPGEGFSVNFRMHEVSQCGVNTQVGDVCVAGFFETYCLYGGSEDCNLFSQNCPLVPLYVAADISCQLNASEFHSYESLRASQYQGLEKEMTSGNCKGKVTYFLVTDGSGKGGGGATP